MNCDQARELLIDDLDPVRRAAIDAHCAACPACRAERDALHAARAVVERAAGTDADARIATANLRLPVVTHHPSALGAPWLAAAAGIALAFAAGYVFRGTDRRDTPPPSLASTQTPAGNDSVAGRFVELSASPRALPPLARAMLSLGRR